MRLHNIDRAAVLESANRELEGVRVLVRDREWDALEDSCEFVDRLQGNPDYYDDCGLTEAGFLELHRLAGLEAERRALIEVPRAASLEDLDYAHHRAQFAAAEAVLDGLQVQYLAFTAESNSCYIELDHEGGMPLKLRFADHARTAMDHNAPALNVAPGAHTFTAVLAWLIDFAGKLAAPDANEAQG